MTLVPISCFQCKESFLQNERHILIDGNALHEKCSEIYRKSQQMKEDAQKSQIEDSNILEIKKAQEEYAEMWRVRIGWTLNIIICLVFLCLVKSK
jgi:hypothetical protein